MIVDTRERDAELLRIIIASIKELRQNYWKRINTKYEWPSAHLKDLETRIRTLTNMEIKLINYFEK